MAVIKSLTIMMLKHTTTAAHSLSFLERMKDVRLLFSVLKWRIMSFIESLKGRSEMAVRW